MTRRPWHLLLTLALTACASDPIRRPRPAATAPPLIADRLRAPEMPESLEPAVSVLGSEEDGTDQQPPTEPGTPVEPLRLKLLLDSVEQHFPLLLAAYEEIAIAAGKTEEAAGSFDTKLYSKNRFQQGFYDNQRFDLGFEQPTTLWGTTFSGGYRLGRGTFDPTFDGKAVTDETGELRFGLGIPLLQGRAIDPYRVKLWKSELAQQRVPPIIVAKQLKAYREAAQMYWKWVSAGRKVEIAERLLQLAQTRRGQIQAGIDNGVFAAIDLVENQRNLADRRGTLQATLRLLQQAAIKLSLFLRDDDGAPIIPTREQIPPAFPAPRDPATVVTADDEQQVRTRRPELQNIQLTMQQVELDLDLARNDRLPRADLDLFASQDFGAEGNSSNTKGQFESGVGFNLGVPIQRRSATGREIQAEAKLSKLRYELRYAEEKAVAEVRDAASAMTQAWLRYQQSREYEQLARRLEEAERERIRLGSGDLFRVNQREQSSAKAASSVVDSLRDYYQALAAYRAAAGVLDPAPAELDSEEPTDP